MQQPSKYLIGALLALVSLALMFGAVRCTDENEATKPLGLRAVSYNAWRGVAAAPATTEAPATEVTEAAAAHPGGRGTTDTRSDPEPTEPAPQSHTTRQDSDGDDSAAWACLAVLESGNGSASPNIYGIIDSRAAGMSRYAQLAYARRIRDNYGGSYAVGWPETSKECGLS